MADESGDIVREPTQNKPKSERSGSLHLLVMWLSQTSFFRTAKRFKEVWTVLVFLGLIAYTGFSYFAPASELEKVFCALEHQRAFVIKRDEGAGFRRDVKSLRDQKELIVDFLLLLLQPEEDDSSSVSQFKSKIRKHLDNERSKINEKIHELELRSLVVEEKILEIDRAMAGKRCPSL